MAQDSVVKDLDRLYAQAKASKAALEPVWILNEEYTKGNQWVAWNGRQVFQPSLRPNRITVVENYVLGAVEKEVARMTKNRPVFVVTPSTADDEDVNAAALGEQVMRYLWQHLHVGEIVVKALRWSRITGAGFVKVFWDSTIGDSTEVLVAASTNKVLTDAQGAPMRPGQVDPAELAGSLGLPAGEIRVKRIAQGDLRFEARSPFQIFPDPIADTWDELEWVIEESVKSKEYVLRRYGVELQADTPANPGMVEARLGGGSSGGSPYKGVKLREYWAKPSSQFPQGQRAVWAQGRVLEQDSAPFDCNPYVMFSGIQVPGRLWPTSIAEQLRGPQTELNKALSQMRENANRLGNPTLLASKQAVQDPEKFAASTSTPGGIYYYDDIGSPNALPKYLEAPQLPEYISVEPDRIKASIQDISGQHEVTQAQVPPGVTAASAITLLQEADDTRLGPSMTDFENQLGKIGQKAMDNVAHYYTDQRIIRLAGSNGAWQIFPFRGAMLKGNTHVEVQAGSAFPQSKATKQAALTDILRMLAQMGYQFSPQDLAQFLQDYELGGADRLIEQYTKNETQINRENVQLAQGVPRQINDWDDDEAHIQGHEDFQKSQQYEQLPPEVQHIFGVHVGAHRERLSQQQQAQLEQQLRMQQQVDPKLSPAALQDQHELSQLQGQTQMQMDTTGAAQQQGFDQAAAEQKQRQAEEEHRQRISHADQKHQAEMHRQSEVHEANIARIRAQAQQQRQQGGPGGRRNAA